MFCSIILRHFYFTLVFVLFEISYFCLTIILVRNNTLYFYYKLIFILEFLHDPKWKWLDWSFWFLDAIMFYWMKNEYGIKICCPWNYKRAKKSVLFMNGLRFCILWREWDSTAFNFEDVWCLFWRLDSIFFI